jgi:PBSX family phage terminase large subunit
LNAISSAARQALLASALEKAKARVEARRLSTRDFGFRGANRAVQTMTDPEILLAGPAGTGKTVAILKRVNDLMWEYPGARALFVRKVRADLAQSVLVTFERDILGLDNPICAGVQRASRLSYRYPNGSEIAVGGMDRPGSILSTEYDIIYPAEAVQFDPVDWEAFVMRNRNYVLPFQQIIADTNPAQPTHWLKQRCDAGITKLMPTFHKDNPAYWDAAAGDWTPRGRDYVIGKLQNRLSGVYKKRYFEGLWTIAEGAVYEDYNEAIHLLDPFPIPRDWRRFRSIDFGYNNPFVCQWWAVDPDGNLYRYREIYMSRRTVSQHAAQIRQYSTGENIEYTVADHDAEDRATLAAEGIATSPAKKAITVGIQAVQERLKVQGNGKPRIFLLKNALVEKDPALFDEESGRALKPLSTEEEFPGYIWPKGTDGKVLKEVPVDLDNHGMDALRYAVMSVDSANTISIGEAPDVLTRYFEG